MKSLFLGLVALVFASSAMAKCRVNVNGAVDVSDYKRAIETTAVQAMISDQLESQGYRLSSNDKKAKGTLTYSVVLHDGGEADISLNFSYMGDRMTSLLTHKGKATSVFGARLDDQVAKYIASTIPDCEE